MVRRSQRVPRNRRLDLHGIANPGIWGQSELEGLVADEVHPAHIDDGTAELRQVYADAVCDNGLSGAELAAE